MNFRSLAVVIVIIMDKLTRAGGYRNCQCKNIASVSTFCDITYSDIVRPLKWQDFCEHEIKTIQSLNITFSSIVLSQPSALKDFFQFDWLSLNELVIWNDLPLDTEGPYFQMAWLEHLHSLTKLKIRLRSMTLSADTLQSPLHLRSLDVSENSELTFSQLATVINASGTELEELYANRINDFNGENLDDSFFSSFGKTKLRIIHVVDSNIKIINSPNLCNYLPFLEEVDVSNNSVDIYKSTYKSLFNLTHFKRLYGSSNLIEIIRDKACDYNKVVNRPEKYSCLLFGDMANTIHNTLEVLSIRGTEPCKHVFCEYSSCTLLRASSLRELRYINCCFKHFDVELKGLHMLEIFDFSINGCEYISPLVFFDLKSLRTLLLNGNELSIMANRTPDEFKTLTRSNINLITLDLSSNGLVSLPDEILVNNAELNSLNLSSNQLSYLPKGIFANNSKLELLDLSNNLLSATDWLSINLRNLRILNISRNKITTLDSGVQILLETMSFNITILLTDNPLDCSCDNNDIYIWLSKQKSPNVDFTEVFCTRTGIALSTHIIKIDSFSYECKMKSYIGLFGLSGIPVIIVICTVIYYRRYQNIIRIRRIRKQLKDFAKEHLELQKHFLLYLAYSFSDSETVLKYIFPELEARLQRELNVDDKLVCISDRDFGVGTSISDEIIRAVSSSTAVMFVISKEFASSRWCEFESEIAIYQQKPIIIVVLEQIKINSFPSSLRKVCYKWTRLDWPGKDDINMLDDFWKKITKAVIKYADVK